MNLINEEIQEQTAQAVATAVGEKIGRMVDRIIPLPEMLQQKQVARIFEVSSKTIRLWEIEGLRYYKNKPDSSMKWYKTEDIYAHVTKYEY